MAEKESKIKQVLHWQAPEFHFYEKDSRWFWKVILGSLVLIIFFIYLGVSQKQLSYYLAAGMVLAAGLALISQAKVKPETSQFQVNEEGIVILNRKHSWSELKTFWLSDHSINFELQKRFSFPLSAPLGQLDPNQVREFLLQYLPEKTNGENLIIEQINRLIKF